MALSLCSLAFGVLPVIAAEAGKSGWRAAVAEGDRRLKYQELELAEGCFRQAWREVRRDPAASADDVAYCARRLAALLQKLDITSESVPLYKRAIKILERAHGKTSVTLIGDLRSLADVFENDGEYKKALELDSRAVELAGSADHATLADAVHASGRLNFKVGRPLPAELCYRSSLRLLLEEKALSSSDLLEEIISDYCNLFERSEGKNLHSAVREELLKDRLALLPQKRGVPLSSFEKEVSVRLANEAVGNMPPEERGRIAVPAASGTTTVSGPISAPTPNAEMSRAQIGTDGQAMLPAIPPLQHAADFAADQSIDKQKVEFYERMIVVDIKTLGPEHPSVARDLSGLAATYLAGGKLAQSRDLFMRALKIYEKVYGGDALLVRRTRAMLELISETETAQNNGSDDGAKFTLDLPPLPLAAQKIDIAVRLSYLASLCFSHGRLESAGEISNWAVADTFYTTGQNSILLAAALKDNARVLRTMGNTARAKILEDDANAITRNFVTKAALGSYQ